MLTIELEAHNATRNVNVDTRSSVERDLLGDWCVNSVSGAPGVYGQERRFAGREMDRCKRESRAACDGEQELLIGSAVRIKSSMHK